MATVTEDFNDNSLDTSLWNVVRGSTNVTVSEANQQLEVTIATSGSFVEGGITSDVTYDFTASSTAGVSVDFTKVEQINSLMLTEAQPSDLSSTTPFADLSDWYRMERDDSSGSTLLIRKKISGSITTIASLSGFGTQHEILFPDTGNEVRFEEDGTEVASEAHDIPRIDQRAALDRSLQQIFTL